MPGSLKTGTEAAGIQNTTCHAITKLSKRRSFWVAIHCSWLPLLQMVRKKKCSSLTERVSHDTRVQWHPIKSSGCVLLPPLEKQNLLPSCCRTACCYFSVNLGLGFSNSPSCSGPAWFSEIPSVAMADSPEPSALTRECPKHWSATLVSCREEVVHPGLQLNILWALYRSYVVPVFILLYTQMYLNVCTSVRKSQLHEKSEDTIECIPFHALYTYNIMTDIYTLIISV